MSQFHVTRDRGRWYVLLERGAYIVTAILWGQRDKNRVVSNHASKAAAEKAAARYQRNKGK